MSFSIVISSAVRQEMAAAYEWYRAKNAKAATSFKEEVLSALELIARTPDIFPLWDEEVRRFVLKHYPYTVYFVLDGCDVRILAIGHHRRRAGYWLDR